MPRNKEQKIQQLRREIKIGRQRLADFVSTRNKEEQVLRNYIVSREQKIHDIGGTL